MFLSPSPAACRTPDSTAGHPGGVRGARSCGLADRTAAPWATSCLMPPHSAAHAPQPEVEPEVEPEAAPRAGARTGVALKHLWYSSSHACSPKGCLPEAWLRRPKHGLPKVSAQGEFEGIWVASALPAAVTLLTALTF